MTLFIQNTSNTTIHCTSYPSFLFVHIQQLTVYETLNRNHIILQHLHILIPPYESIIIIQEMQPESTVECSATVTWQRGHSDP